MRGCPGGRFVPSGRAGNVRDGGQVIPVDPMTETVDERCEEHEPDVFHGIIMFIEMDALSTGLKICVWQLVFAGRGLVC